MIRGAVRTASSGVEKVSGEKETERTVVYTDQKEEVPTEGKYEREEGGE